MTSIVVGNAGNGLGLQGTSLDQQNGPGSLGSSAVGSQGRAQAYVNAETGNLVVQTQDEFIKSLGLGDESLMETYNSLGNTLGTGSNGWLTSFGVQLNGVSAAVASGHASFTRTGADGHVATFTWTAGYLGGAGAWVNTSDPGVNEYITYAGSQWTLHEGGTGALQTYNLTGQLLTSSDLNGNTLSYTYASGSITIKDSKQQSMVLTYTGTLLTGVTITTLSPGATSGTASTAITNVQYKYDTSTKPRLIGVQWEITSGASLGDGQIFSTQYTYVSSTSNLISQIVQSDGCVLNVTYYANNKVKTLTDGLGRTTTFVYGSGNTAVTDALGNTTTYNYSVATGLLSSIVLPPPAGTAGNGGVIQYWYDSKENISEMQDADGRISYYIYDSHDNCTQIQTVNADGKGNTVQRTYDSADHLTSETTFLAEQTVNAKATATASNSVTTYYIYDNNENLNYVVSPQGEVTQYQYNANGTLYRKVAYVGQTYAGSSPPTLTSMNSWYSGLQNVTGAQYTTYAYDLTGQLLSARTNINVSGPATAPVFGPNNYTYYLYNGQGQLLMQADGDASSAAVGNAHVTSYAYDGFGRTLSVSSNSGSASYTTSTGYTGVSLPALGSSTSTQPGGQNLTVTASLSTGLATITTYDADGEVISVAESGGGQTLTSNNFYDADGRRVMSMDAAGNRTIYIFDNDGRQVGVISPDMELTQTIYNKDGQAIQTVTYATPVSALTVGSTNYAAVTAYLNASASSPFVTTPLTLASVQPASSSQDVSSYSYYDNADRLAYTIDGNGTVTGYQYAVPGWLSQKTVYATPVSAPPAGGNAASVTVTGSATDQVTHYFQDSDGRTAGVLDPSGTLTQTFYNAAGQTIQQTVYGNPVSWTSGQTLAQAVALGGAGISQYWLYDAQGWQVASIDGNGTLTKNFFDAAGNKTQQTVYTNPVVYAGQTLTALVNAASVAATDQTKAWTYDGLNRIASGTDAVGSTTINAYGSDDQLDYTVDAQGNVTGYDYDAFGRKISTTQYAAPISLAGLPASPSAADIATAVLQSPGAALVNYTLTSTPPSTPSGAPGTVTFSPSNPAPGFTFGAGGLTLTNPICSAPSVLKGGVVSTLSNAGMVYHYEFKPSNIASSGTLYLGALGDNGNVSAMITNNGQLKARVVSNGVTNSQVLTNSLSTTSTYEVDVVMTSTTQTVYVYLKNQPRGSGWSFSSNLQLGSAQAWIYAGQVSSAGQSVLISKMSEAQTLGPGAAAQTVYNNLGQAVYSIDALGGVTGHTYDSDGRVIQTTKYAQPIVLSGLPANPSVADIQAAMVSGGTQSNYDLSGYTGSNNQLTSNGTANMIVAGAGPSAVLTSSGAVTGSESIVPTSMNTVSTLGTVVEHAEFNQQTPSAGQFYLGAVGKDASGNTLRLAAYLTSAGLQAYSVNSSGTITISPVQGGLQSLAAGVTYVSEVVVTAGSATLYVYVKGQSRASGSSFTMASGWAQTKLWMQVNNVSSQPSGILSQVNVTSAQEYQALSKSASVNETAQTVYNGLGEVAYSIDPQGNVTGYLYNQDGDVTSTTRYAAPIVLSSLPANPGPADVATALLQGSGLGSGAPFQQIYNLASPYNSSSNANGLVPGGSVPAGTAPVQFAQGNGNELLLTSYNESSLYQTTAMGQAARSIPSYGGVDFYGEFSRKDTLGGTFYMGADGTDLNGVHVRLGVEVSGNNLLVFWLDASGAQHTQLLGSVPATSGNATTYAYEVVVTGNSSTLYVYAKGQPASSGYSFVLGRGWASAQTWVQVNGNSTAAGGQMILANLSEQQVIGAGRVTQKIYNALGQVAYSIDAAGYATGYVYNQDGAVIQTTRYSVPIAANLLAQINAGTSPATVASYIGQSAGSNPPPNTVSYTVYNAFGQIAYDIDGSGEATGYVYNSDGAVTQVTRYGQSIGPTYLAQITATTTPGAISTYITQSAGGNPLPPNEVSYTVYNGEGEVVYSIDALGNATGYSYNNDGQVTQVTRYGTAIASAYLANITSVTTPSTIATDIAQSQGSNPPPNEASYSVYNNLGQLAYSIDAMGDVTGYGYNVFGQLAQTTRYGAPISSANLAAITPTTTPTTIAGYLGQATAANPSAVNQSSYSIYNSLGQIAYAIDAAGAVSGYRYDALGRVVQTTHYGQIITAPYLGQITSATSPSAIPGYISQSAGSNPQPPNEVSATVYNTLDEVAYSIDALGDVTGYEYDAYGEVTSTTRYAAPINIASLPANPSVADIATAALLSPSVAAVSYGMKTSSGTTVPTGLSETGTAQTFNSTGLVITNPNSSLNQSATVLTGNTPSSLVTSGMVYHSEFTLTNTNPSVTYIGATGDNGNVSAIINGSTLKARAISNGVANVQTLGTLVAGVTYECDVVMTATAQTVYVYQQGQSRASGWSFSSNIQMNTAQAWINAAATTNMPSQTLVVSALSEAQTLGPGEVTQTVYNANGQVAYSIDALGDVTGYQYDQNGRVIKSTEYAVAISAGNMGAITAASTLAQVSGYLNATDLNNRVTRTIYNSIGQVAYSIDAMGDVTSFSYNRDGRVTSTTKYALPVLGQLVTNASGAGNSAAGWSSGISAVTAATAGFTSGSTALQLSSTDANFGSFSVTPGQTFNLSMDAIRGQPNGNSLYVGVQLGIQFTMADGSTQLVYGPIANSLNAAQQHLSASITVPAGAVSGSVWLHIGSLVSPPGSWYLQNVYAAPVLGFDGSWLDGASNKIQAIQQRLAISPQDQTTKSSFDADGNLLSATDAAGNVETYTYDTFNNKRTYTNKIGNRASYTGVSQSLWAQQHTWTYQYDAENRLIEEDTPLVALTATGTTAGVANVSTTTAAIVTKTMYDAFGNISERIENATGVDQTPTRVTGYRYDQLNRQVRVINADQVTINGAPVGRQVGVYVPAGTTLGGVAYKGDDGSGYGTTTQTGAAVNLASAAGVGNTSAFVAQESLYTDTLYNALGQAIVNRDAAGNYSFKVYDTLGRVSFDIDADGYITQYQYDAFDNQKAIKRYSLQLVDDATSGVAQTLANLESTLTTLLLSGGGVGTAAIMSAAIQANTKAAALAAKIAAPNADSAARTLTTSYDGLNRKIQVVQPGVDWYLPTQSNGVAGTKSNSSYATASPTTSWQYDAFGDVIAQKNLVAVQPSSTWATTWFGYDLLGRQTDQVDALGYYTQNQYDAFGRLTQTTEYAQALSGGAPASLPAFGTLAFENLITLSSPSSVLGGIDNDNAQGWDRITQYGYDLLNRQTSVTRANTQYAQLNNQNAPVLVDGSITTITDYDAMGNAIDEIDAQGNVYHNYYDALGRLVATTQPRKGGQLISATPLITMGYDALGDMVQQYAWAYNPPSLTSYTYQTPAPAPGGTDEISYQRFDVLGHATETIDAMGTSQFSAWDAMGRTVRSWNLQTDALGAAVEKVTLYQFDAVGQQTATVDVVRSPDSGENSYSLIRDQSNYDAFGEIVQKGSAIVGGAGGGSASIVGTAGNGSAQTTIATSALQEYAQYDADGRLWQTNDGSGIETAYRYDLLGNQTAKIVLPSGLNQPALLKNSIAELATLTLGSGVPSPIETDTVRDGLGRATAQIQASFTTPNNTANDLGVAQLGEQGVTWQPGDLSATWEEGSHGGGGGGGDGGGGQPQVETNDSYNYSLPLKWLTLAGYGGGALSVTISYTLNVPQSGGGFVTKTVHAMPVTVTSQSAYGCTIAWNDDTNDLGGGAVKLDPNNITDITVSKNYGGSTQAVRQYHFGAPGNTGLVEIDLAGSQLSLDNGGRVTLTDSQSHSYTVTATAVAGAAGVYTFQLPSLSVSGLAAGTINWSFSLADGWGASAQNYTGTSSGTFQMSSSGDASNFQLSAPTKTVTPVIQQTLDRWGNVLSSIDPRNQSWVTYYKYNDNNQVIETTRPSVSQSSLEAIYTDSTTGVTTYDLNPSSGTPKSYAWYDYRGKQIASEDADGNTSEKVYNQEGELTQDIDGANSDIKNYYYNVFGQMTLEIEGSDSIAYKFDTLNRMTQEVITGNSYPIPVYLYTYDESGDRTSYSDGNYQAYSNYVYSDAYVTHDRFDTRGDLIAELTPMSVQENGSVNLNSPYRTTYTYDLYENKVGATNNGITQTWTYDYFDNVGNHTDLGGVKTTYQYTALGQLWKQSNPGATDPRGYDRTAQNLTYGYYENGQIKTITDGADQSVTTYEYDAAGHHTLEQFARNGTLYQDAQLSYDALGRLVADRDLTMMQQTYFDAAGNRAQQVTHYQPSADQSVKIYNNWYAYDADNRMVLADGYYNGSTVTITANSPNGGAQGHQMGYNAQGDRTSDVSFAYGASGSGNNTPDSQIYTYDDAHRVASTFLVDGRTSTATSTRWYDGAGRVTTYADDKTNTTTTYIYNVNGQVLLEKVSGQQQYQVQYVDSTIAATLSSGTFNAIAGFYRADGNVDHYNYVANGATTTYSYQYLGFDTQKEWQISAGGNGSGDTTEYYDSNGNLSEVIDSNNASAPFRFFVNDTVGIAHARTDQKAYNGSAVASHTYFYANNGEVGCGSGDNKDNNFDLNYTPVTASSPSGGTGNYVLQAGDTEESLALAAYGDSSLWYLIADANGLTVPPDVDLTQGSYVDGNGHTQPGSGLTAGQTIVISQNLTTAHNNSSTFAPYDPSQIIGSTTPTVVPPPGPRAHCVVASEVIGAIVGIVVTIFAWEVASEYWVGYAALFAAAAAGAAGAAAGSAAQQTTYLAANGDLSLSKLGEGMAVDGALTGGVPDPTGLFAAEKYASNGKFSVGDVGVAAAAGGASAAASFVPYVGPFMAPIVGNLVNQTGEIAIGHQQSFSWAQLAGAAVAGAITEGADLASGLYDPTLTPAESAEAASSSNLSPQARMGYSSLIGIGSGVAGAEVTKAMEHNGTVQLVPIAVDAFANVIATSIQSAQTETGGEMQATQTQQSALQVNTGSDAGLQYWIGNGGTVEGYYAALNDGMPASPDAMALAAASAGGLSDSGYTPWPSPFSNAHYQGADGFSLYVGQPNGAGASAPGVSSSMGAGLFTLGVADMEQGISDGWDSFKSRLLPAISAFGDRGTPGTWGTFSEGFLEQGWNTLSNAYMNGTVYGQALSLLTGGSNPFQFHVANDELGGAATFEGAFFLGTSLVGLPTTQSLASMAATRWSELGASTYTPFSLTTIATDAEAGFAGINYATNSEVALPDSGLPGFCFVKGTLVHTENGTIPIEKLRIGDRVLSQPQFTGERDFKPILNTVTYPDKPIWRVTIQTANGRSEFFDATANHPFWVKGLGWRAVEALEVGAIVELHDWQHATVRTVSDTGTRQSVYNFEVADFHTYYVGEIGVWVHNTNCAQLSLFSESVNLNSLADLSGPDSLAAYRVAKGMAVAGSEYDASTIARLDIGGQTFFGESAHDINVTIPVNAQTATHAEAAVFQQALDAGATADTATLYIDHDLCASCGALGGVGSLVRGAGLQNVVVVSPSGTYVITAARPSVPLPFSVLGN